MKQLAKECVKEVIEVYGNFEGVSKNSRGVLGKFHGCHREITRVFLECFTGVSRLLSQFQGEFQEGFKDVSSKFQSCLYKVSTVFLESLRVLQKVFGLEV